MAIFKLRDRIASVNQVFGFKVKSSPIELNEILMGGADYQTLQPALKINCSHGMFTAVSGYLTADF